MDINTLLAERQDLEQRVIERAWRDDDFRQRLLTDPKSAAQEVGIELPTALNIIVHEETPTTIHFVLPENPAAFTDSELSDAELEMVAGGSASNPSNSGMDAGAGRC